MVSDQKDKATGPREVLSTASVRAQSSLGEAKKGKDKNSVEERVEDIKEARRRRIGINSGCEDYSAGAERHRGNEQGSKRRKVVRQVRRSEKT